MPDLSIRELDEEEFQSQFDSCRDGYPLGLVLDGEVIGLVNVFYDHEALGKLRELGIRLTAQPQQQEESA
jgi:hypothetical protein